MMVELETKTLREWWADWSSKPEPEYSKLREQKLVSLDSHDAAMKELERDKQIAFEAGRDGAKQAFLALLAEQRKDVETELGSLFKDKKRTVLVNGDDYEQRWILEGKKSLLVLLEEKLK